MKCSFKTMLPVAGVMFAVAGFAYFAFEDARAAIVASLPVLVALLCPISMLVMMKFMHSAAKDERDACGSTEAGLRNRSTKGREESVNCQKEFT